MSAYLLYVSFTFNAVVGVEQLKVEGFSGRRTLVDLTTSIKSLDSRMPLAAKKTKCCCRSMPLQRIISVGNIKLLGCLERAVRQGGTKGFGSGLIKSNRKKSSVPLPRKREEKNKCDNPVLISLATRESLMRRRNVEDV
jgi:hypothetical protein